MWQPSTSQQAANANGEKNIDKGNKEYAAAFTQGDLALPPSQKYAVCTCNQSADLACHRNPADSRAF
jgi:hypothetical protein